MAQISFDLKKTDKATGSTPFKNVIPFLNKNFRSSKSPSYDSRRTSPHTGRESSLEKVRILSESSPITVDRSEPRPNGLLAPKKASPEKFKEVMETIHEIENVAANDENDVVKLAKVDQRVGEKIDENDIKSELLFEKFDRSVGDEFDQSVHQTENDKVDINVSDKVDERVGEQFDQTVHQTVNCKVDQTVIERVDEKFDESVQQTHNDKVDKKFDESVGEKMNDSVDENAVMEEKNDLKNDDDKMSQKIGEEIVNELVELSLKKVTEKVDKMGIVKMGEQAYATENNSSDQFVPEGEKVLAVSSSSLSQEPVVEREPENETYDSTRDQCY